MLRLYTLRCEAPPLCLLLVCHRLIAPCMHTHTSNCLSMLLWLQLLTVTWFWAAMYVFLVALQVEAAFDNRGCLFVNRPTLPPTTVYISSISFDNMRGYCDLLAAESTSGRPSCPPAALGKLALVAFVVIHENEALHHAGEDTVKECSSSCACRQHRPCPGGQADGLGHR